MRIDTIAILSLITLGSVVGASSILAALAV